MGIRLIGPLTGERDALMASERLVSIRRLPGIRGLVGVTLALLVVLGGIYGIRLIKTRTAPAAMAPTVTLLVRPHAMGDFLVLTVNGITLSHHLVSLTWVGSPPFHQTAQQAEAVGHTGNPDGHTTFEVAGQSVVWVYGPAWRHRIGYIVLRVNRANGKPLRIQSPRLTL